MAVFNEKRVMLSYNWKSQEIVSKVYNSLTSANIPVWMDIEGGMKDDIYKSMAEGIEQANIVCCFMSPEYQASVNCKLELQYAQTRGKRIIPCIVTENKKWKPEGWLGLIVAGLNYINFKEDSDAYIQTKTNEIIDRINDDLPIQKSLTEPTYLIELIKHKYTKNARIERIMNPAKSYPIEQSYINLAIVKSKEQQEKEKELRDARHDEAIIGSFEEIYGAKLSVDAKDIFEACKTKEKQVLVFGRAGIGKSTFCRCIAYQWGNGTYWPEYKILALIPLRRLTTDRYPPNKDYALIDIFKGEVFDFDLNENDDELIRKQFDLNKILWILDGYDEIVQNTPPHLKKILEQLLKTPHHIIASRPYMNTLSYDVQMEITGFTDENIEQYVKQFFEQMKDEFDDTALMSQTLLNFLKTNRSIWGVAHIPVNLELICSLWSSNDWEENQQITITTLYTMITEWLCRRYLKTDDNHVLQLCDTEIEQRCHKELSFLEYLAFNAMETNVILLRPVLLKKAMTTTNLSIEEHPNFLNIGILKSFHKTGIGNQIEMNKDHYFVHLSFQEYFAARHLINMLTGSSTEKAIEFIKRQKYNQRYSLVFAFTIGLISRNQTTSTLALFWDTLLTEPIDLVGIRHMQLILLCIEEIQDKNQIPRWTYILDKIDETVRSAIITHNKIYQQLPSLLSRTQSVLSLPKIESCFIHLIQSSDTNIIDNALQFITSLQLFNPTPKLLSVVSDQLAHENERIRNMACHAVGSMCEKTVTTEMIHTLATLLEDKATTVKSNACHTLKNLHETAATTEVINKLVSLLDDGDDWVVISACTTLGELGKIVVTTEVINKLLNLLEHENKKTISNACNVLGNIGEKAATAEIINKLVNLLESDNTQIITSASTALRKMGNIATTTEVINKLVNLIVHEREEVRNSACYALGYTSEKPGAAEVLYRLVNLLDDENELIVSIACDSLGRFGKTIATTDVINKLVNLLEHENKKIKSSACNALGKMSEKVATTEMINKLGRLLDDESEEVRLNACHTLACIGEKAGTTEIINKLVSLLEDENNKIKGKACSALWQIGEKVATTKVINKLVSLLDSENEAVRTNACYVLGCTGEKAGTTEVTNKLVSLLESDNRWIRDSASNTLGKIGKAVATTEVIDILASLLEHENKKIRNSVCNALGKIGEKAATIEIINKLVSLLEDHDDEVRKSACTTLGKIGEKAVTIEVINKLVSLLGDRKDEVRRSACNTFAQMGKKAATTEVINKLVNLLDDNEDDVRRSACTAFGYMGEKAAATEVISKLMDTLAKTSWYGHSDISDAMKRILNSPEAVAKLAPSIVSRFLARENTFYYLTNLSEEDLVARFVATEDIEWLTPIVEFAVFKRTAFVVVGEKIVCYGSKESIEFFLANAYLRQQFIEVFIRQAKELHLYFDSPSTFTEQKQPLPSENKNTLSQNVMVAESVIEEKSIQAKSSRSCNIL